MVCVAGGWAATSIYCVSYRIKEGGRVARKFVASSDEVLGFGTRDAEGRRWLNSRPPSR